MKQIIITIIAVVAIIGGAIFLSSNDEQSAGATSNNYYGADEAVVTLTEYGDFECPACAGFFPIVSQVKEQFKDQLRFEFKHFPLVQIHQNATAAHRAAQAAANQGKFWEMHDLLYQSQSSWNGQATTNPTSVFEQYARDLNLDMDQFIADAASSNTLAIINADIADGKELGTNSTPTFYLDGEQIEDLSTISTVEGLTDLIQNKINEKTGQDSAENDDETSDEQAKEPEDSLTE